MFWKHGFADASLQELEKATGVNKSGLYAEFSGKEELFLESLRFYLEVEKPKSAVDDLAGMTYRGAPEAAGFCSSASLATSINTRSDERSFCHTPSPSPAIIFSCASCQ